MNKKEFLTDFNGHANAYASFMVIDVKLDDLITALNKLRPDGCFGSGQISDRGIYFEGCKESPDGLLSELTAELHCKGFADIGSWYGYPYFCAYKNGEPTDEYVASWDDLSPGLYDEGNPEYEDYWDAFFIVEDPDTGVTFNTGDGCVDGETKERFEAIINAHSPSAVPEREATE